jgi:hypothetical protein
MDSSARVFSDGRAHIVKQMRMNVPPNRVVTAEHVWMISIATVVCVGTALSVAPVKHGSTIVCRNLVNMEAHVSRLCFKRHRVLPVNAWPPGRVLHVARELMIVLHNLVNIMPPVHYSLVVVVQLLVQVGTHVIVLLWGIRAPTVKQKSMNVYHSRAALMVSVSIVFYLSFVSAIQDIKAFNVIKTLMNVSRILAYLEARVWIGSMDIIVSVYRPLAEISVRHLILQRPHVRNCNVDQTVDNV